MAREIKVQVEHDIGCGLIVAIGLLIGVLLATGKININIGSTINTPETLQDSKVAR